MPPTKADSGWETHRRHLVSRPSPEGLRALGAEIAPGAEPTHVRRIGGGIATATHAVSFRERSGATLDVVLKRFPKGRKANLEWDRLRFAQRLSVGAPEPVAVDRRGRWFGTPAIVTRRIAGRADHAPADLDDWLSQIARVMATIHDASTTRLPAAMKQPSDAGGWKRPDGLRSTELIEAADQVVRKRLTRARKVSSVVSHGDFHPGNLLWSRGRLVGVVDWAFANLAARPYDVAYCRADLAVLLGVRAAERFRVHYEGLLGSPVPDLPVWDLSRGLLALRWSHLWVPAYHEQGARALTVAQAHARVRAFLRQALASA